MARKADTGWRDSRLPHLHRRFGFELPMPGASFLMLEYDRGKPVGFVNCIRRDADRLPVGRDTVAAYAALAALRGGEGEVLPFLTVMYDPRTWSFQGFGHNEAAWDLMGSRGWLPLTEEDFVGLLYGLRGRVRPDLGPYGIRLSTTPWQAADGPLKPVPWPCQDFSVRRRGYEPEGSRVPMALRNPCSDIDLVVTGASGRATLFADYKLSTALVNPGHQTYHATSRVAGPDGVKVPSVIVRYEPGGIRWAFSVLCLNAPARSLVARSLGKTPAASRAVVKAGQWGSLTEGEWLAVLGQARAD